MTASQRRLVFGSAILLAGVAFYLSFRSSLVPATHPDHDHGILNIDAGGHLVVQRRDGSSRNLVGAPGKVLVVHFFDPKAAEAAPELRSLLNFQATVKADAGVDFVVMARNTSWSDLDAWLARNALVPPVPASLYLDPDGDTTGRFNSKRPVETMFFGPRGKLASQARGRLEWGMEGLARIEQARAGATIE